MSGLPGTTSSPVIKSMNLPLFIEGAASLRSATLAGWGAKVQNHHNALRGRFGAPDVSKHVAPPGIEKAQIARA
jgi:hypothetical protein